MRVRFGLTLLLVLLLVLLATSSLKAESVQQSLVFQSLDQHLDGSVAAGGASGTASLHFDYTF